MKKIEGTRLTQLKFSHMGKHRVSYYEYMCECGTLKVLRRSHVKAGRTKSCGCLNKEVYPRTLEQYYFKKGERKGVSTSPDTEWKKGGIPWNKGLKTGLSWKKGKIMIKYPNGKKEWIQVEPL